MNDISLNPDGPHSPDITAEAGQLLDDVSRFIAYATMAGKGGLEYPADVYRLLGDLYAATGRGQQICGQIAAFLKSQLGRDGLYDARKGEDPARAVADAVGHLELTGGQFADLTRGLQVVQADISGLGVNGGIDG